MLNLLRARPTSGWVAVAPQADRVRAVHLVREPGHTPALRWACTESWAHPPLALRALRRTHWLAGKPTVVVMPHGQYQVLILDTPDVPREDWRDAIRWRLKDVVAFPVEDAGIDLLDMAPDSPPRRHAVLMAVAAPRSALALLTDAAADAGLRWQAIDVPETALRNVCLLCADAVRCEALLHVGSSCSTLVVTAGTELLAARDIDTSLERLCNPDPLLRRQHHERAGLELQRTLDTVERQFSQARLARLQVAPGPPLQGFIDYVRDILSVPVVGFELGAVLDLSAVPELVDAAQQAAYLPAIGAALR